MSTLSKITDQIQGIVQRRMPSFRPAYPLVALEMDAREMVLVRLKRKGRGKPTLEAHEVRPMPEPREPLSMFRPSLAPAPAITGVIQEMFTKTGTKPGKISLVIPDNVAKISLLSLPERPPTRKQLEEILRFKLRRSVPFRMDDAIISYQVIPAEGKAVNVLVALMHRLVVEQFEAAVRAAGARPGLVDLCTPNLLNLCRKELDELNRQGHDAALLNCAGPYFSLVIIRNGRIIFFRSKSLHGSGADGAEAPDAAVLARELNHSLAYYQEKLNGTGVHTLMVRTVVGSEAILPALEGLGFGSIRTVDPASSLEIATGMRMESSTAQRLAPAVSAATGRGR